MNKLFNAFSFCLFILVVSFGLFFLLDIKNVKACTSNGDCWECEPVNGCCGNNVCNTCRQGDCGADWNNPSGPNVCSYEGCQVFPEWTHVEGCEYGCSDGACSPGAPEPTATPIPEPTATPVCTGPRECETGFCANGDVCATGHEYCLWDNSGWGTCSEEVNNCATQCPGPTSAPTPTMYNPPPPPPPPPGVTPTPTTPPVRRNICSSTTVSPSVLPYLGYTTITSTATENNLQKFRYAFFNRDNGNAIICQTGMPSGSPCPGGSGPLVIDENAAQNAYSLAKVFNFDVFNKEDVSWGNKKASHIQVNGYFVDRYGMQSLSNVACTASFDVDLCDGSNTITFPTNNSSLIIGNTYTITGNGNFTYGPSGAGRNRVDLWTCANGNCSWMGQDTSNQTPWSISTTINSLPGWRTVQAAAINDPYVAGQPSRCLRWDVKNINFVCPTAQSCATCHTNTYTVPDGNCGNPTCSPNAPAYQADLACTTSPVTRHNGDCTDRTQSTNCSTTCSGSSCVTYPVCNAVNLLNANGEYGLISGIKPTINLVNYAYSNPLNVDSGATCTVSVTGCGPTNISSCYVSGGAGNYSARVDFTPTTQSACTVTFILSPGRDTCNGTSLASCARTDGICPPLTWSCNGNNHTGTRTYTPPTCGGSAVDCDPLNITLSCSDADDCTTDTCTGAGTCIHTNNPVNGICSDLILGCDGDYKTRTHTYTSPTCGGNDVTCDTSTDGTFSCTDFDDCTTDTCTGAGTCVNTNVPVNGTWSPWVCDTSCGDGTETRTCNNSSCGGTCLPPGPISQACNIQVCPAFMRVTGDVHVNKP